MDDYVVYICMLCVFVCCVYLYVVCSCMLCYLYAFNAVSCVRWCNNVSKSCQLLFTKCSILWFKQLLVEV